MTNSLRVRPVADLLNQNFFIPYYQRGYRWTEQQVEALLEDIDNFFPQQIDNTREKTFYCLQPIVVKACSDAVRKTWGLDGPWFEVIDGQQRLTTIFLIIHYANEMWVGKMKNDEFVIKYETRSKSAQFLKEIQVEESEVDGVKMNYENIDFYYIAKAYKTINDWVASYPGRHNGKVFDNNDFQSKLKVSTKVIWYEVMAAIDSVALFSRLNMGKIPLTNAELIKALFLSSSAFEMESEQNTIRRQTEMCLLWDEIELQLNDKDFWSFITNAKKEDYETKIGLLLDLIPTERNSTDPHSTFIYFQKRIKDDPEQYKIMWSRIEQFYQTLFHWYRDPDLYHKIGFLVTVNESLSNLIYLSLKSTKSDFHAALNRKISAKVALQQQQTLQELTYEADYRLINNILLLFNVESIRCHKHTTEKYPFTAHKSSEWSLEHIHARNSESIDRTNRSVWRSWLEYHKTVLEELIEAPETQGIDEETQKIWRYLLMEINKLEQEQLTWERFSALSQDIINSFSKDENVFSGNATISNLALLRRPDNTALNNSVFEVKRRDIIRLDKEGKYIPICTRRAFLKYYNEPTSSHQYFIWTKTDRENYIREIEKKLAPYFKNN